MRGRAAQKASFLGGPGGPLANDFLLALRGGQRYEPLPEPGAPLPGRVPPARQGPLGPLKRSDPFPAFIPRLVFTNFGEKAAYFPPHMSKGIVQMQKKLPTVDCLLEASPALLSVPLLLREGHGRTSRHYIQCLVLHAQVRDARAPLTSSGCVGALKLPKNMQRLVVLNKCDLVSPSDAKVRV